MDLLAAITWYLLGFVSAFFAVYLVGKGKGML